MQIRMKENLLSKSLNSKLVTLCIQQLYCGSNPSLLLKMNNNKL